jgi:iron complex outermembrane recepter protein
MKRTHLSMAIAIVFAMSASMAVAQDAADQNAQGARKPASGAVAAQRGNANASSTSNTTNDNATLRSVQQLNAVQVRADSLSLGGGLMSVQTAPKAVSTITRDAIVKASAGSNFTQLIATIPGVNSSTDDVTGLADGNYSIRGFASNEIGVTVNGAPINDSGSYQVFASEYGDQENIGDITVLQGIPDVDMPDAGAAGGHIAWATIDPSHQAGVDFNETYGSHDYHRTFVRLNTGDMGPVRSWLSYSDNSVDKWRGAGDLNATKVDGKALWTIDDSNSISASLQYNRQVKNSYENLTKAQIAKTGYFSDWDKTYKSGSDDSNFYGLHNNVFSNYMFSLDGEFKLADSLRLSVVPYFQYGDGGSGSGNNFFQETTNNKVNNFENANQDLNQDGAIVTGPNGKKSIVYAFSRTTTWRPGIVLKFNQDLGINNSLEYGLWYEKVRQEQSEPISMASFTTGMPNDLYGDSNFVLYPDGSVQKEFDEYTITENKKLFVTDTWTPTDQWTLTLGAAYLHTDRQGLALEFPDNQGGFDPKAFGGPFDAKFHKVTPTFGVKFDLDEHNQFYYGVGETYRAPPNTAVSLNLVTHEPSNKPEQAWNNDLGWRFYDDRFSASASIYRSNFTNRTVSGFNQELDESFSTQIGRVKQQGFNGEASFKFADNWKIYGSYTYTQSKLESEFDAADDGIYPTKGKTMINAPRNIGHVSLSYDNGPLWASLTSSYHGSFYGDFMNTEKAGGYTTFNFSAGYHFDDFASWFRKPYIKVNVANITDRHALLFATNAATLATGTFKDANGDKLFTTAPQYSILEPRTFMVTVGASFF